MGTWIIEQLCLADGSFCLQTNVCNRLDTLGGIRALGRLLLKHDTGQTIQESVNYVKNLYSDCSGLPWHCFQHASHRLACL
jgi:hypothetical protein